MHLLTAHAAAGHRMIIRKQGLLGERGVLEVSGGPPIPVQFGRLGRAAEVQLPSGTLRLRPSFFLYTFYLERDGAQFGRAEVTFFSRTRFHVFLGDRLLVMRYARWFGFALHVLEGTRLLGRIAPANWLLRAGESCWESEETLETRSLLMLLAFEVWKPRQPQFFIRF